MSAPMILRLRNVNRVRSKGRVYLYHRKTGARLDAHPDGRPRTDAEIVAAWQAEEARTAKTAAVPGTLGGLIDRYRASPEYLNLAEKTRRDYARILDGLVPLKDRPLHEFTTPAVMAIRDKAAARGYRHANYVLAVLSRLFAWGLPRGITTSNPVAGAEKVRRPRDLPVRNRPWTDAELAWVLAAAADPHPGVAMAVRLAAASGQRETDVVGLTRPAVRDGVLHMRQGKTGNTLEIPLPADLVAAIDALPRSSPYLVTRDRPVGRNADGSPIHGPYTPDGFRSVFFRLLAELEEHCGLAAGLTFHGLRHTAGVDLALRGATTKEIMAVLGCTQATAERYTKWADQRRLAASGQARRQGPRPAAKNGAATDAAKPD